MLGGHFSHIAKRLEESELQPAARLVLFVICSATDKRSGGSVIAASKLAKRTGLSEGHCRRMVAELLAGGWLTVSKVGHNRNKYTIVAELPAIGVRAGARSVYAPARGSVRAGARTTYLMNSNTSLREPTTEPTDLAGKPVEDLSDGNTAALLNGRRLADLVREQSEGVRDAS